MNLTTGETLKEYKILELIGQSELENYYSARHVHFDTPAHVRELKPQHLADADLRTRYVAMLLKEMGKLGLEENIHFFIVNQREQCCLIRNTDASDWGEDGKLGVSAPPPNAALLAGYHDQVQLLCRVSLPVNVLMGLTLLGWMFPWSLDGVQFGHLVMGFMGVALLLGALAAIGMLEQRLWGHRLAKVAYFALFASAPLLMAILDSDRNDFAQSLVGSQLADLTVFIALPFLAYPIAALVVLYSKKAKYYFR